MTRPHDPFFDGDPQARRPGLRLAAEDGQRAPQRFVGFHLECRREARHPQRAQRVSTRTMP